MDRGCRQKGMQAKRASITGEKYINGMELLRALAIGRTTLNRCAKAGKLPKPAKSISGMLLFRRGTTYTASK